ncbi:MULTISPECIES: RidA family protein [unclassified Paenibacillus]|uniref:RidA family protein n=1 Tax=unclassified Paenibacillus TaxID=185978 RepID=UPI001AE44066|nr:MULTISPECIES: RidA family protein [unclassified Paenibacillus]MBP1154872.1 enamine deaminase RidA (YjgF/YER057c/UK114 family) [Paenibacillus sp. PvP091]MBP1169744.1 enamine deaminase RidA (YjgF/YER057c/UK114 family) [Paenibacillus sp. PvR098]MBP2440772.1 enamine deaminase RidA (YjgF/YER057c/UK114 family) [Paenibacillus sp. PvP052]
MAKIEKVLEEKGIILSTVPAPIAQYVLVKQVGNLVYTSGFDCRVNGKLMYEGKVGSELTLELGKEAARQGMINIITVLKEFLGDLDRIKQVVKMLAFVNSAEGFVEQPYVINGASDLLVEVFGEKGKHARSAVSANELPFNTPIEIELIVEIE